VPESGQEVEQEVDEKVGKIDETVGSLGKATESLDEDSGNLERAQFADRMGENLEQGESDLAQGGPNLEWRPQEL
jgi:hypothetical protein